jgi:hypothetical protein
VEHQLRITLVESVERTAERPVFGLQQGPHGLVGGVRGGEHLRSARDGQRPPEQDPADTGPASGGIHHEKLDEVPAEEVSRPNDHEAGHGPVSYVHLALAERQVVPEELSPFAIAPSREIIGAQEALQVISDGGPDPGRDYRH